MKSRHVFWVIAYVILFIGTAFIAIHAYWTDHDWQKAMYFMTWLVILEIGSLLTFVVDWIATHP